MFLNLLKLFWTFFKIGLFTIGGGYAMIPMIETEAISQGWLTEEEMVNFLAVSESTPGPFAINIATFIGNKQFGLLGGAIATFGVILPSIIIIICIFKIYQKVINNKHVNATLNGVKGVVIGLIFAVACGLIVKELFGYNVRELLFSEIDGFSFYYKQLIIFGITGALMLIFKKKLSPILLIVIGAFLGIVIYGFIPLIF